MYSKRQTLLSLTAAVALALAGTASADHHMSKSGVLTDNNGMTVYTFDNDTPDSGESACYNQCAVNWPPVSPDDVSNDDIGAITRKDGSKQATYKGAPLYYFVADKAAGDKKGDGLKGVWHVVKPGKSMGTEKKTGY